MPSGLGDLSFFRDFKILFTLPHVICTYSILATSVRLCGNTSMKELSRVNTVSMFVNVVVFSVGVLKIVVIH